MRCLCFSRQRFCVFNFLNFLNVYNSFWLPFPNLPYSNFNPSRRPAGPTFLEGKIQLQPGHCSTLHINQRGRVWLGAELYSGGGAFVVAVNDWGAGTVWRGSWPRGGRYVLLVISATVQLLIYPFAWQMEIVVWRGIWWRGQEIKLLTLHFRIFFLVIIDPSTPHNWLNNKDDNFSCGFEFLRDFIPNESGMEEKNWVWEWIWGNFWL